VENKVGETQKFQVQVPNSFQPYSTLEK
jgi:hypothetical protein